MVKTGTAPASIQRYSHCPSVGPGVSGWMEKKAPRTSPQDSCSTACRRSRWVVPARARDSRYCLHKEVWEAVWEGIHVGHLAFVQQAAVITNG